MGKWEANGYRNGSGIGKNLEKGQTEEMTRDEGEIRSVIYLMGGSTKTYIVCNASQEGRQEPDEREETEETDKTKAMENIASIEV